MRNAVILDYEDGTIDILPIPYYVQENGREEDYVQMHPAFDSDTCSYMIVEGDIQLFKVTGEEESAHLENGIVCHEKRANYIPIAYLDENTLHVNEQLED